MARPKGSPNVKTVLHIEPPRCPNCESTKCTVLNTGIQEYAGFDADGKPYNRIVRRRVQCTDCQRVRIDRSLEFHQEQPAPPAPPEADADARDEG